MLECKRLNQVAKRWQQRPLQQVMHMTSFSPTSRPAFPQPAASVQDRQVPGSLEGYKCYINSNVKTNLHEPQY